jgi:transcriptional antiterminator NusG
LKPHPRRHVAGNWGAHRTKGDVGVIDESNHLIDESQDSAESGAEDSQGTSAADGSAAPSPPQAEAPAAAPEFTAPLTETPDAGEQPPLPDATEQAVEPPAPATAPAPAAPTRRRAPTAAELQPPEDPQPQERKMDWYILKVQSNREDSIRDALQRRIAIEGLEEYFADIIVPVEMVSEFKNGKKRVVKRKLYPGYIVVRMEITEETWFLVRETPGIGDFTGAGGKPTPMAPQDVAKILAKSEEKTDEAPKLKIKFSKGDRVKITEGTFENFEGDVDNIDEANGRVTVMINIFGRSTPVELEYWQVESI